ncbi:rhomboid family intramembrane serine protease [Geothermobacter hydrogeniphilus]|uniref:rhomboid family intramembrane serine protease n=1 Tax=Geothermobacter hydrogeniphilus TaxID=1969733 RepID=UPI001304B722|nr:rhomboid family intramembrane serine protease [Geothermobacter hydrogeniphilus]
MSCSTTGKSWFQRHPDRAFLLQMLLCVGLVYWVRLEQEFLRPILFLMLLFSPVYAWLLFSMKAVVQGQSGTRKMLSRITFLPVPITEDEWRRQGFAWCTYGLILVNVGVFYLGQLQFPSWFENNLLFLPRRPNAWNIPVSVLMSSFLHGGRGHLWGNMFFLWAMGTVVERRIGGGRFLLCYLVAAVTSGLFFFDVMWLATGQYSHLLGASGAISGIIGLYAVRCYFKTMLVPFPLLGLLSLFYPVYLQIRMNALLVIGVFFLSNLDHGIGQLTGTRFSYVAHWAHLGGLGIGLLLGWFLRLAKPALQERHLELSRRRVGCNGFGLDARQLSLETVLDLDPDNVEARLELARVHSRHRLSEQARTLYLALVRELVGSDPKRAADIFREYLDRYWQPASPDLQYRMAGLFFHFGDLPMASRCLDMLLAEQDLPSEIREKAMFQMVKVLFSMKLADPAREYADRFKNDFPQSALGFSSWLK